MTAPPSVFRRMLPKLAVSILLGVLFAWLVSRGGVPLLPSAASLAHVAWWAVPAYVVLLAATTLLRATRWRHLIAPVKVVTWREAVLVNWVGFFAIFALPLRIGELARPALSRIRDGIPVSVGLGTIAVERVIDGMITSLCVAWAVFALPRLATHDAIARTVPIYSIVLLCVFASAFASLAFFLWQRALAVKLVERVLGLASKRLGRLVADKIAKLADGLRSIKSPRLAAAFLTESIVYWTLNAIGMWVLARGVGLPMSFGQAVAVMGILAIGILLPAGPGMFGNFQLAVSAALKLYFAERVVGTQGAAYVFLLYGVQATFISLAGIIPLYAMKVRFAQLLDVQLDPRPDAEKLPVGAPSE